MISSLCIGINILTTSETHLRTFVEAWESPTGGMTFHDFRTTVKTNMLRAGIDKALRDTILGHSLSGMDAFYIKPSEEDLHQAMDKFTHWVDKQLISENVDQSVDQKRN